MCGRIWVAVGELSANGKGVLDVEEKQVNVHDGRHGLAQVQRGLQARHCWFD